MNQADDEEQERIWNGLYQSVVETLRSFGEEDAFGKADYLVVDDNYGWNRVTVEIHQLRMLDPGVIEALKNLVVSLPGWQIVIAVDIPGTEEKWPPMGIIIRPHETVDGLQREYLPPEWQRVTYPGSRVGTS